MRSQRIKGVHLDRAIAGSAEALPSLVRHRGTIHSKHDAYAVCLAVRYVENTIAVNEHTVRS
jgi:hypothetical protein